MSTTEVMRDLAVWAAVQHVPHGLEPAEAFADARRRWDSWLAAHDAEVRASVLAEQDQARILPDPKGGCCCTWHTQDAGGGHTEYLLEYEPACPEHSKHVYNPRTGVWEVAEQEYGIRAADDELPIVSTMPSLESARIRAGNIRGGWIVVRRRAAGPWLSVEKNGENDG